MIMDFNKEAHLHFTVMDAAELAHEIGYTEWMELFQEAFLKMKPPERKRSRSKKTDTLETPF